MGELVGRGPAQLQEGGEGAGGRGLPGSPKVLLPRSLLSQRPLTDSAPHVPPRPPGFPGPS